MPKNPFNCKHEHTEVRERKDAIGRPQFVHQCLDCGERVGDFTARAKLVGIPKPWDDALQAAGREQGDREQDARMDEIKLEGESIRAERMARLAEYYLTREWKAKSAAVLKRDGYTCQAGFAVCTIRATQAHHKTYDHVFNEPLFDLVAICHSCHCELHEHMKREQGGAA